MQAAAHGGEQARRVQVRATPLARRSGPRLLTSPALPFVDLTRQVNNGDLTSFQPLHLMGVRDAACPISTG